MIKELRLGCWSRRLVAGQILAFSVLHSVDTKELVARGLKQVYVPGTSPLSVNTRALAAWTLIWFLIVHESQLLVNDKNRVKSGMQYHRAKLHRTSALQRRLSGS